MDKKLYRSNKNKMICGVCGGVGEFFNIDPTLVRLGWVVFCALGGSGILAYIIAAIIIPLNPEYWSIGSFILKKFVILIIMIRTYKSW